MSTKELIVRLFNDVFERYIKQNYIADKFGVKVQTYVNGSIWKKRKLAIFLENPSCRRIIFVMFTTSLYTSLTFWFWHNILFKYTI